MEATMTKNFPRLMSDTKPQIQGANKMDGKKKYRRYDRNSLKE